MAGPKDFEIGVNEQDLINNGVLCYECGSFIGDAIGKQRLCEDCGVLHDATEEK